MSEEPQFLTGEEGRQIAYHKTNGTGPTVIFCGGYMSDMEGTKAIFLENACKDLGLSFVRFDYSGHGRSSEDFVDGTIGKWTEDALSVVDQLTDGDLIVIGSSMGGWVGLLVSLARKTQVKAYIGIAAAPDFTRELMWEKYSDEIRETLKRDGVYLEPSEYSDEPYRVSYGLIQDGENHILLNNAIDLDCPVRLFHGLKDADVPYEYSSRIADRVVSEDVIISFNKTGDHRLSSDADLDRLKAALVELVK
ncbi:alpha/beta hydrolase [Pseudemcibacter aquimaris]|uniref:alpha/beta hydrolase n=1 Tax=Pseudemcibacter aquimaris TaxID=2857064 RepID=UPI0020128A25|nr:alpha/beta hydrolase [Pseudemcibacter aquimaris]MCC3861475.1 alpha/beta hydrolase [Pseudemcibacter aquimaris]WDU58244.1 alpha/beta hydrolase [Pseudemcibacter aquimaris]